jgi:hypothetical protein
MTMDSSENEKQEGVKLRKTEMEEYIEEKQSVLETEEEIPE